MSYELVPALPELLPTYSFLSADCSLNLVLFSALYFCREKELVPPYNVLYESEALLSLQGAACNAPSRPQS